MTAPRTCTEHSELRRRRGPCARYEERPGTYLPGTGTVQAEDECVQRPGDGNDLGHVPSHQGSPAGCDGADVMEQRDFGGSPKLLPDEQREGRRARHSRRAENARCPPSDTGKDA